MMSERLSDELILEMIRSGDLKVQVSGNEIKVEKRHGSWKKMHLLKTYEDDPGRLCYRLRVNGFPLRKIFRNKLVWMWANDKVVPEGFNVDHENNDSMDDRPCNLRLMHRDDSNREGCDRQHWDDVAGFFDYIAFTGMEPSKEFWP